MAATVKCTNSDEDQSSEDENDGGQDCKGKNNRFKDGLSTLGVLEQVISHPTAFREVFTYTEKILTARYVEDIFEIKYSEEGSNTRNDEMAVVSFWRDYLIDVEERDAEVTLQDIIVFATGQERIPPLGFCPPPALEFLTGPGDGRTKNFPVANTCSNILRLPIVKSYDDFKFSMEFGVRNSHGFGCV
ncbi:G2/M phase-specific E3 ubiquitin-protein ligase-like [Ptychodera flava]|uniref:G2/M phase-specific E3 ubiquitin-protein ligase-like n=1 Tax=Ptychodera flava TaxID=63121 RepID=UPI00396A7623